MWGKQYGSAREDWMRENHTGLRRDDENLGGERMDKLRSCRWLKPYDLVMTGCGE